MGSQNSFDEIVKNRFENWEPASGDITSWTMIKSELTQRRGITGATLKFLLLVGVVSVSLVALLFTGKPEPEEKQELAKTNFNLPPSNQSTSTLPNDQKKNSAVFANTIVKEAEPQVANHHPEVFIDLKSEWLLQKKLIDLYQNSESEFPLIESRPLPIIPSHEGPRSMGLSVAYSPSFMSGTIHPNLLDETQLTGLTGPGRFSTDRIGHSFNIKLERSIRPWLQVTGGLIVNQNNFTLNFLKRGSQVGGEGSTLDSVYQVHPVFGTIPGTFSSKTLLFGPNASLAILLNKKSSVIQKVGIGAAYLLALKNNQFIDNRELKTSFNKPNTAFSIDYTFLFPLKNGFFIETGPCYTYFSNRIDAGIFSSQTQSWGFKIGVSKEF